MSQGEPSGNEHNAPWNENDEVECACSSCRALSKKMAREEYLADMWSPADDYDLAY
jgi:hypothetical protein